MKRGLALAPAAALLLLSAPAAGAPRTHVVVMDKMQFGALPTGARVGESILWVNHDMFRHTATATNGMFNVNLAPGARGVAVLAKSGAIPLICKYHPRMRAVLRVRARGAE